jgi:hypothetical protein
MSIVIVVRMHGGEHSSFLLSLATMPEAKARFLSCFFGLVSFESSDSLRGDISAMRGTRARGVIPSMTADI